MKCEHITSRIIGGAMKVHSALGPGLLESAYRACLTQELTMQGLNLQCEWPLEVHFNGVRLDVAYKVDLLVEDSVIFNVLHLRDGICRKVL